MTTIADLGLSSETSGWVKLVKWDPLLKRVTKKRNQGKQKQTDEKSNRHSPNSTREYLNYNKNTINKNT